LADSLRETLSSLVYGIQWRKGFLLVCGEKGIGKSSLAHYLAKELGPRTEAVVIDQTGLPIKQLLKEILLKLGLSPSTKKRALW